MLIYEYKLDANRQQYAAIDEAIRVTQFVRNKCIRLWIDTHGTNKNDLQCYCAHLAKAFPFASLLNSQARQAAADRAWFAISQIVSFASARSPWGYKAVWKRWKLTRSCSTVQALKC